LAKKLDEEWLQDQMSHHESLILGAKEFELDEYKRRHKSIMDTKIEADRYIISLPDRTNMLEKMGFDRLNEDHREVYLTFCWELERRNPPKLSFVGGSNILYIT
jgi:hypothetical protein